MRQHRMFELLFRPITNVENVNSFRSGTDATSWRGESLSHLLADAGDGLPRRRRPRSLSRTRHPADPANSEHGHHDVDIRTRRIRISAAHRQVASIVARVPAKTFGRVGDVTVSLPLRDYAVRRSMFRIESKLKDCYFVKFFALPSGHWSTSTVSL